MIGVMAAQGGCNWCCENAFGKDLFSKITLFAFENLPWSCRVHEWGKAGIILNVKRSSKVSVLPVEHKDRVINMLNIILTSTNLTITGPDDPPRVPVYEPMANFLSATLMNLNSLIHTSLAYRQFKDWDGVTPYPEKCLLYEGADAESEVCVTEISNDLIRIREAVTSRYPNVDLSRVMSVYDFYCTTYKDNIKDKTNMVTVLHTNNGYQGLTHAMVPPSEGAAGYVVQKNSRYFMEDIPCGLSVTRGVAQIFGVETPMMDKIITWAQELVGKEYLKDGKLEGRDLAQTRSPQKYGLTSMDQLLD
jgi:hypothetical protein